MTHVQAAFPCDATSPKRARAVVVDALRRWGLDDERIVDDAELVTAELVTNAVLHAATPLGLLVAYDRGELTIEVRDQLPVDFGLPTPGPDDDVTSPDDALAVVSMTGRGLALVGATVDGWGIDVDAGGKTVWTTLRAVGSTDRAPARRSVVATTPEVAPARAGGTSVTLLDVPTAVVLANIANLDDRARELSLLDPAAAPSGLVGLASTFRAAARGTATGRLRGRRAARAAAARGDARFTSVVPGDRRALRSLEQLTVALATLDAFAREGDLLAPPAPAPVVAFREWVLVEAARQLDGAAPRPYPA